MNDRMTSPPAVQALAQALRVWLAQQQVTGLQTLDSGGRTVISGAAAAGTGFFAIIGPNAWGQKRTEATGFSRPVRPAAGAVVITPTMPLGR